MSHKRIIRDGVGNGADSDVLNRILERLDQLEPYDSQTIRVEKLTRGKRYHAKPSAGVGSSTSKLWMYPDHVELDTRLRYDKGTFTYISPNNPLVTTGMIDAVSGLTVKAFQGIYEAVVDVPPQTTDTPPKYNVPLAQVPQGAVSGTPLKGDFDSPTIFWRRWPQNSCF